MHEKDCNHPKEWAPSLPLRLLAGCATFPLSLIYGNCQKNEESQPEPVSVTNPQQYAKDLEYRQRFVPARHRPPSNLRAVVQKPRVRKERGGKEDYEDPRKSRQKGKHGEKSADATGKSREPVKTSTPIKDRQKRELCCDSADGVNELYPVQGRHGKTEESWSFNRNSMCRDCIEKYEKGIQLNYVRNLTILWFPPNFSQSKFGDRRAGSNACTLICILVSYKCHKTGLKLPNIRMQEAWEPLMNILAESIVEGNSIHERLRQEKKLVEDNLTVPEAIAATRNHVQKVVEWESTIVTALMKTSLFDYLSNKVMQWYSTQLSQKGSDLYVIVISVNRSVTMIFQRESETVTLVDSHSHYPHGAAVAQVPFKKLRDLCNWYACMLMDSVDKPIKQYELSYLYFAS